MWVSKKKIQEMERKITALEKERLSVMNLMKKNIKSDEELIKIVNKLRNDIKGLEPVNTNGAELTS